jgi:hypothetical protein
LFVGVAVTLNGVDADDLAVIIEEDASHGIAGRPQELVKVSIAG